jgi:hypothetical protein
MNKFVAVVCLAVLAVSLVNTWLLLQAGAKLQKAAEKLEPVTQEIDKLRGIIDRLPPPLPVPPKPGEASAPKELPEDGPKPLSEVLPKR